MNVKNTLITNNCVVFMIVKKNIVLYNFPYMGRMQLPPVENRPPARFWYGSQSLCPTGEPWS